MKDRPCSGGQVIATGLLLKTRAHYFALGGEKPGDLGMENKEGRGSKN